MARVPYQGASTLKVWGLCDLPFAAYKKCAIIVSSESYNLLAMVAPLSAGWNVNKVFTFTLSWLLEHLSLTTKNEKEPCLSHPSVIYKIPSNGVHHTRWCGIHNETGCCVPLTRVWYNKLSSILCIKHLASRMLPARAAYSCTSSWPSGYGARSACGGYGVRIPADGDFSKCHLANFFSCWRRYGVRIPSPRPETSKCHLENFFLSL